MSQNEQFQSDLRQSSTDDASNHAHNEEAKVAPIVPGLQDTSELDCRAEQNHHLSTARENAIASLIVLANIVPVY